jgi:hypothetical protein
MKKFTSLFIAFFYFLQSYSTQCTSVCNGNFCSASTWSCGQQPGCGDTIIICAGTTCTVSTQLNYSACSTPMHVIVNGQLNFDAGNKLSLPSGSSVTINSGACVSPGNGGGSSNLITIGTTDVWGARSGPLCGYAYLSENTPLPVELVVFQAILKDGIVELSWTTLSETNNDFFNVERTRDGKNFETIMAIDGAGSSSSPVDYKGIDNDPFDGVSYYRLSQTDFNGSRTVFGLADVNTEKEPVFEIQLFQNPGDGSSLTIEITSEKGKKAQLEINDLNGKKIYDQNIVIQESGKSINELYLPDRLTPGVYLVNITSEESAAREKLIIQ